MGLARRDCPGVFAGKERCAARSGATRKGRDADQRTRPRNRKAAGAFWRMAVSLVGHDAFSVAPLLVPPPAPKSAPSRWVKPTLSRSNVEDLARTKPRRHKEKRFRAEAQRTQRCVARLRRQPSISLRRKRAVACIISTLSAPLREPNLRAFVTLCESFYRPATRPADRNSRDASAARSTPARYRPQPATRPRAPRCACRA